MQLTTDEELLTYTAHPFDRARLHGTRLPLQDEAHVADWRRYLAEAGGDLWPYLQARLPQLAMPIRDGQSKTDAYADTIRRGQPFDVARFGGRLQLERPDAIRVEIHDHPAGALPVVVTGSRQDFETVYRALACRSEPVAVNPSVNAQMIAGIVNWDRVARLRATWAEGRSAEENAIEWPREMSRVAQTAPERLYDRLILLAEAPYSGRAAREMGLHVTEAQWLDLSTRLRLEHEFTHYATKRLFGAMRLNLYDEIIADAMGMTHALGTFRAAWFLKGLGLDTWPTVSEHARVHTYRAGLSDDGFRAACAMTMTAAAAVERLTERWYRRDEREAYLLALTATPLDVLASADAEERFEAAYRAGGSLMN